jgi:RecJ-like exonuclease
MTEETKKLIDELPKHYYQCDKCNGEGMIKNGKFYTQCGTCNGEGTIADKCVFIEDVIAIVEKLTGENERIINIIRNYFHCNNNIDYQSFEQAYGELSYLLDVEYPNKNKIEVSDNDLPY